jgi:hypothetical protein
MPCHKWGSRRDIFSVNAKQGSDDAEFNEACNAHFSWDDRHWTKAVGVRIQVRERMCRGGGGKVGKA